MQGLAPYPSSHPLLPTFESASLVPQQIALPLPPPGAHASPTNSQSEDRLAATSQPHLASGPDSSNPTGQPLLPPFSSRQVSHLPTPQSPSSLVPYVGGPTDSPTQHGTQGSMFPATRRPFEGTRQMVTPESSPLVSRGWALPGDTTTTPTQPRRAASPQTPPPALQRHPSSPASNLSQLSSPFMPKRSPTEHTVPPLPSSHPSRNPTPLHLNGPDPDPADVDADADAEGSDDESHAAGGEIERIRIEQARARATLLEETESRRPDYLRRAERPFSATTELDPVWGIKDSPAKGRRIELWGFTETSDESFEDRLMAGGYVGYGSTPGATMPTRPRTPSRAKEWANIATPGPASSSKAASLKYEDEDEDVALDDRAVKKKRRLAAFRRVTGGVNAVVQSKAALQPVEVEGKGRVLLDLNEEEVPELVEGSAPQSPASRKRGGKRKRRGAATGGGKSGRGGKGKVKKEEMTENAMEVGTLNWPDEQFPWSLRTHERREVEQMEETERMKSIARFFEGDSDEDDDEEEDPQPDQNVLVPMDLDMDDVDMSERPVYRGRGKMVPLHERDLPDAPPRRVFFPSDPADARAALLSKRSVRALAARRRLREMSSDSDNETVCICHGTDDGRELVQCDDCKRWYHLDCIGLTFEDLGKEEDPWYCDACEEDDNRRLDSNPSSEPMLVRGDEEDLTPRRMRDPLFFQSDPNASPVGAMWRTPTASARAPRTPTRNSGRTTTEFSTRSSWGSGEDSVSRHGPRTPQSQLTSRDVRVYSTPGAFEQVFEGESPFDPTTTPSRGIRFPAGVQKEGTGAWASARYGGPGGGPFVTPTQTSHKHALPRYERTSGGQYLSAYDVRSAGVGEVYDDTPVDRTAPRPVVAFPPRRQLESPLMGRGAGAGWRRALPGPQESPSLRAKGKGRGDV